ncbi:SusC/RagA family protein [Polaribacter vadi]|uniref:SusC/RagA family TonB-linked outer membrane protein n=1 Tax=Polaribacter vadi TaxID=1774273 RepID=A0A1B8TZM3_9FLAO|nr:SusC/RagA family TonB-linked outer membrane protein [Polaribacter vadi]AOW17092.1 SusC/RagA family protein [Polaribacter vadi]OBY64979.1 SusC/RagA family TonB-linked outer membrane protein [Polaribacter vadi]
MKQTYKKGLLLFLFLGAILITNAQSVSISGTVNDSSGALPGVSVSIKGTSKGTETDFDGKYTINAEVGNTLVYRYLGYKTNEKVIGNSRTINVTMAEDNSVLDEVIVVAFGTTTKEAFTGSASVVDAKDLALRSVTSPIAAIEGKATGVQFLAASGQPGSSPGIVIRGVGTLNGSTTPLYILDGMQFDGSLSSINQDDIASMTVLKDAASTSLYGSRAANGVIIITTKKGKKNKTTVSATSQYSVITRAVDDYDMVGAGSYYELMWEGYKNTIGGANPEIEASATIFNQLGYNPFNVPNDQIVGTDGVLNPNATLKYESLNWLDYLERTGSRKNHSVNVASGGENHSIFYSASYLKEEGYVIESDYERVTNRLNADFTPIENLSLGGSVYITTTDSHGPTSGGSGSIVNPFNWANSLGPIYPVYQVDNDGKIVNDASGNPLYDLGEGYPANNIQTRPYNPGRHGIAELILNEDQTKQNLYGFRNYIEVGILDGLKAKVTYGRDIQDGIIKGYENEMVGDGAPTGRYSEDRYRRVIENFNQILTYNTSINDSHNLDVTLGHESMDRNYSILGGIANTQTATGIYEFDNFAAGDNVNGNSTDHRIEGYFARLNYNFDNKYYLSASARRDGTSRFSKDVRWGTFYSVGGSWRIDQEKFMENVSFIDRLKLRASYGEIGNERIGSYYASQALYTIIPNAGAPGIFWSDTGNSELEWENQVSWDVALEFGLFNNLIDGSIEFYKKNSVDLLYSLPIPRSEGLNEYPTNIGDIYNQGIELSLTGHLVRTKDVNWDLTLQASTLKNEITKIDAPSDNGSKRWEEGRSRYDFYIYHYAGVNPDNGDALYYMFEDDADGGRIPVLNTDGTQATTNDYQDAGEAFTGDSSIPDLIGSVSNTFRYKQFSLDLLFTFGIGGKILDGGYSGLMHPGTFGNSMHVDAENAWRQPGDITDVPRLENGNPNQTIAGSTRFLTDASYAALRNVNLGYNLDKAVTDKLGLSDLRISLSGENMFINAKRKGINPQYNLAGTQGGNDFNPARVVTLGLNLSF